jgi:UDP-N-acetylglucosamine 1-carboxyvinyltransferase
MQKLIINGPASLQGEITVSGSKNHVLPMMAACLLCSEPITLHNVPEISDVEAMLDILELFGVKHSCEGHKLTLDASDAHTAEVTQELADRMRASILVLGPAVARFGEVTAYEPGGDIIGARPLTGHLRVFKKLGVEVRVDGSLLSLKGRPKSKTLVMDELSVTPVENAIMAAVLSDGVTEIRRVALEPHVVELCRFLNSLGANIEGIDTHNLRITGMQKLHGGEGKIIPDQLEAGTLAIAAAATHGDVTIHQFVADDHDALLTVFENMAVNCQLLDNQTIHIMPSPNLLATRVVTHPYPNFPTDLQAPMAVLMTQADGTSEIFETMYEGRMSYLYELQRMGAHVAIQDSHVGRITGPTRLQGAELISFDIRAGATLLLAALVAEGRTVIERIEHIDRGYEKFDKKLASLGADIERVTA